MMVGVVKKTQKTRNTVIETPTPFKGMVAGCRDGGFYLSF